MSKIKIDDYDLRVISSRLSAVTGTLALLGMIISEAAECNDESISTPATGVLMEIHNAIHIGIRDIYDVLELEAPIEMGNVH